MWAEQGEWGLSFNEEDYPKEILNVMNELIKIFNENVHQGCCGGCI